MMASRLTILRTFTQSGLRTKPSLTSLLVLITFSHLWRWTNSHSTLTLASNALRKTPSGESSENSVITSHQDNSSNYMEEFGCPAELRTSNLSHIAKFCPFEFTVQIVNTEDWKRESLQDWIAQKHSNVTEMLPHCILEKKPNEMHIVQCHPASPVPVKVEIPVESPTFRKCCDKSQQLRRNPENGVVPYICDHRKENTTWNLALFSEIDSDFDKHTDMRMSTIPKRYEIGMPNCPGIPKSLNNDHDIWFKVLENGDVFVGLKFWFRPVWLPVGQDKAAQSFCVDELDLGVKNKTSGGEQESKTSHELFHTNQVLIYCEIERFEGYLFHRRLFGALCVTASLIIFFLLIIYLSIWDKQNLAGWTQFNIFVAVFFVFGMEGVRTLLDVNALNIKATVSCHFVAAIAQYFFFALNTTWCVMNFDLFWTFWKLESSTKGTKGQGERICAYLLFSWGLPLIVIVIAFSFVHFEATDSKHRMEGAYAYAHRRCSSPIREFGFQTQGIMFICNVLLFICTAFLIWRHRRGIANIRRHSRSERHSWISNAVFGRVMLFAKLLIVMGVSSLSIPLDYFFGAEDPLHPFEVIFRMFHFIPVVAIFFIFGFNTKNVHLIKQKYPRFGGAVGGIPLFNRSNKRNTTETNPSPSGGQVSGTELR